MSATPTSPWPRRTAYATVLLALPLLLLGGTVTTLRVGMAVPDWPTTFGQNMFTYPLSEMLANGGVFWEHSHRLAGALIGLSTIAMVVAHLKYERRSVPRTLSVVALVAVIAQGVLGGLRVLENSPQLAFLHGSLAQAVFATMGAIAVMHTPSYVAAEPRPCKTTVSLRRAAYAAPLVVYAQIVVGAWLRHSGHMVALIAHFALAVGAAGAVMVLAKRLRVAAEAGDAGGHDRSGLRRVRAWAIGALSAQLVLGVLAYVWVYLVTGPHNPVSIGEAVFATAHVAVGALLLITTVAAALWSRRVLATGSRGVAQVGTELGTAR